MLSIATKTYIENKLITVFCFLLVLYTTSQLYQIRVCSKKLEGLEEKDIKSLSFVIISKWTKMKTVHHINSKTSQPIRTELIATAAQQKSYSLNIQSAWRKASSQLNISVNQHDCRMGLRLVCHFWLYIIRH